MRVWFLKETPSVCPGCSTGCNIYLDHRDGEAQRLRPRRNVEVNKSWMCDPGRALYKEIGKDSRVSGARLKQGGRWEGVGLDAALDAVAEKLRAAGKQAAFVASPQASNEDLFAFRRLARHSGGLLDFRVGEPQDKLQQRLDDVLQRADRNPNTQGCLELGLGQGGIGAILEACRAGQVQVLVLQGPELLRLAEAEAALAKVPFVVVLATHEEPALERAQALLPAAMWAEVDGTFTNYERRVQRLWRAFPASGEARPGWDLAAALLRRLGALLAATSAREVFQLLAGEEREFAGLNYKLVGATGRVLGTGVPAAAEARA